MRNLKSEIRNQYSKPKKQYNELQNTDWVNVKFQTCPPWRIPNLPAGRQGLKLLRSFAKHNLIRQFISIGIGIVREMFVQHLPYFL